MKKTALVFIPFAGISHFTTAVEIAKLITRRDSRLSITVLIINFPFMPNDDTTLTADSDSVRLVKLPLAELGPATTDSALYFSEFFKAQTPLVRNAVHELTHSDSVQLGGFVVDMFCTSMIDVADDFGVPSYLFFTGGAAFLGFMLHLQFLHDSEGLDFNEFKDSDAELEVPSYANSVRGKVFPAVMFREDVGGAELFLYQARRFRQVKGIMVNTFFELESHAIQSLSINTVPPVYPVGPILNTGDQQDASDIMNWLDDQPSSSVVFLCFGSMGSFGEDQVKEIAHGLESSGHRFLWSLRRPSKDRMKTRNYDKVEEVLPTGFLHRTATIGKVIGWAPQSAILAHSAIGGFVSHCGWTSILESVWYGVPIATWPLSAEQQLNAFQMVKDLELAIEIKIDYNKYRNCEIVSAREIEIGLNKLMKIEDDEVRKKTTEMKRISRKVMMDGGSSHSSLGRFIEDMMMNTNIPCAQRQ